MRRYPQIIIGCFVLLLAFYLGGCGNEKQNGERKVPEKLQVQFVAEPQSPQPEEETTFSVTVTQGGEKVNDADDVKFEIWREGQKEKHTMVPAEKSGEGVYSAKQKFDKPGTYYVMYHIDARGLHSMTNHKIEVKDKKK
ncbi:MULTISPECIES: FixH family protein [Aneurinibacillus]|uniref:YtkA-like domain-containing protein n=1 Tax=Aneurinibacillus danicus TaxID=267746 RepID=A0A511V7C7_9BACL|nr:MULTISPECIES: FixH family protein [Aneurinibacillus]GEN34051.1 hypothetical protein ADA01nite_15110 [Aneurinibacillus danicus]